MLVFDVVDNFVFLVLDFLVGYFNNDFNDGLVDNFLVFGGEDLFF